MAENELFFHIDAENQATASTELDTNKHLSFLTNALFSFPVLSHIMELQGDYPICQQRHWDTEVRTPVNTLEEQYCNKRYDRSDVCCVLSLQTISIEKYTHLGIYGNAPSQWCIWRSHTFGEHPDRRFHILWIKRSSTLESSLRKSPLCTYP
jgi:hypothetical protein